MIFKLEIHRAPGSSVHGFQERSVIAGLLREAAVAAETSGAHEGVIVYERVEVGRWSFGEATHVHREHVHGTGPGTFAARRAAHARA